MDADGNVVVVNQDKIMLLSHSSGNIVWEVPASVHSPQYLPLAAAELVVIGTQVFSFVGRSNYTLRLVARDLATGDVQWVTRIPFADRDSPGFNWGFLAASPTGSVYAVASFTNFTTWDRFSYFVEADASSGAILTSVFLPYTL